MAVLLVFPGVGDRCPVRSPRVLRPSCMGQSAFPRPCQLCYVYGFWIHEPGYYMGYDDTVPPVYVLTIPGAINLTPSSWWAQILLTLWWLLCILEVACYGSFLIATLTAPTPTPLPFQEVHGLAALLERNEYKMCIRSGTSFHQQVLQVPPHPCFSPRFR